MTTELARAQNVNMDELGRTAKMLAMSGFFTGRDSFEVTMAQIGTKILAGREMGYGPFASVNGIHVIQGKPTIAANLMAAAVKSHPAYNYRVRRMDNDAVEIEFFEHGESLGVESFTMEDAKAAQLTGKDNWKKFPRNMLFARCMSNGVRFRCPDVFNGNAVYVPEELGEDEPQPEPTTIAVIDDVPDSVTVAGAQDDSAAGVGQPTDNPFEDAQPEETPEEPGKCDKLVAWAKGIARDGKEASDASYRLLAGKVDDITDKRHGAALTALCGWPVNSEDKPSQKLVSKLIDAISETTPKLEDDGRTKVKDANGKVVHIYNPNYKQDVADCLAALAKDPEVTA